MCRGDAVLGRLRPAGQHRAAVGRGSHRPVDRSLALARRDPFALVPGAQSAHGILAAPADVRIWAEQQARRGTESSPVGKMAFSCACLACANLLMASSVAVRRRQGERAVAGRLLRARDHRRAAPGPGRARPRLPARRPHRVHDEGVWFAATLPGDILAGFLGSYWSTMTRANFFLIIAAVAALAGLAVPPCRER